MTKAEKNGKKRYNRAVDSSLMVDVTMQIRRKNGKFWKTIRAVPGTYDAQTKTYALWENGKFLDLPSERIVWSSVKPTDSWLTFFVDHKGELMVVS